MSLVSDHGSSHVLQTCRETAQRAGICLPQTSCHADLATSQRREKKALSVAREHREMGWFTFAWKALAFSEQLLQLPGPSSLSPWLAR